MGAAPGAKEERAVLARITMPSLGGGMVGSAGGGPFGSAIGGQAWSMRDRVPGRFEWPRVNPVCRRAAGRDNLSIAMTYTDMEPPSMYAR